MAMAEFQEVVPGKLSIARGIFADEAPTLVSELEAIPERAWTYREGGRGLTRIPNFGAFEIITSEIVTPGFKRKALPNLGRVASMSLFGITKWVFINRQSTNAKQDFHSDFKPSPVFVLHLSPDGSFDYMVDKFEAYSGNDKEEDVGELPTNVGDVVRIDADFMHRGRNTGKNYRYSVVLFNVATDFKSVA